MLQEWLWGNVPAGFKKIARDRMQMVVVREGLESYLGPDGFFAGKEAGKEPSPFHGRGRLSFLPLGNGTTALVRSYRHGGLLCRITGDFFFTWPPRPFRELAVTEEARRRGIPTLEILGACVERVWGPVYRGWLASRELEGAQDLWNALQRKAHAGATMGSLLRIAAQSVRHMHHQGLYHRDLNLKNILVCQGKEGIRSYVIDFDKARLFSNEVPPARARKNLRRLLRSIHKLDPHRQYFTREGWELFIRFYREAP